MKVYGNAMTRHVEKITTSDKSKFKLSQSEIEQLNNTRYNYKRVQYKEVFKTKVGPTLWLVL